MKLKLSNIKPLCFELELPDGSVKTYEPIGTFAKIQRQMVEAGILDEAGKQLSVMVDTSFDVVRRALGFPTQAEVDAAADPKPFTLAPRQCIMVRDELGKLVDGATSPNPSSSSPK